MSNIVFHWGKATTKPSSSVTYVFSEDEPPQEARYNFPKGNYAKLAGMLNDEN